MSQKHFSRTLCAVSLGLLFWIVLWVALSNPAQATSRSAQSLAAGAGDVVINEVAWGGTAASTADEWIELYNTTDTPITLTNWTLVAADGTPAITLNGVISAGGYFLLERSDDTTVSDIPADQIYVGALGNNPGGESLTLRDENGLLIDTANGDGDDWPAGSGSPGYYSMERTDPLAPDADANWASNDGITRNGRDADGDPVNGTPKTRNSTASSAVDLLVEKSGPPQVWAGGRLTYSLRLRNAGNLSATAVWLTDSLPAPLIFVGQTSPYSFTQPDSHTLVWQVGQVPVSTGWSAHLTLAADVALSAAGPVHNRIQATSGVTEIAPLNNLATATTLILGLEADLSVAKSGPAIAHPGGLITYSLRLSNTGLLTATGVRLTDTLPAAVSFVTQTSPYPFDREGSRLTWALGDVPAGTPPVLITVTGQVSDMAVGPATNLVSATTSASETLRHNNVATWTTQVVAPVAPLDVVINEVAWMGTDASFNDEWIELHNTTESDLDLSGWTLSDGGDVNVALSGVITAGGYYLLERDDDGVITDVVADLIYDGNLANTGETLSLRDPGGTLIDTADGGGGWPAGVNTSPKRTMERINPAAPDSSANWADNDGGTRNGHDRLGAPINGTPRGRNSAYTPPTPPEVDLVVAKSGPLSTTPGALVTYTVSLENVGALVAAGVRLTDTLPVAVQFVTQTQRWAPVGTGKIFTFSHSENNLYWTIGGLAPNDPPVYITVTGRVSATAWGALENVITATTTSTETAIANNVARWTTVVGGVEARVLILAVLADGFVPTSEDDEAVQLVNVGDLPVDLSGWRLNDSGDDTSYVSFGPGLAAVLPPRGRIWLTDDAVEFERSFGFKPDYETADSDPAVPELDGAWPGYSNGGDEVVLLDAEGAIVDALVYGTGNPDEVGSEHWQGPPLDYLDGARNNGQIFARKAGPLIERPFQIYLPVVLKGSGGQIANSPHSQHLHRTHLHRVAALRGAAQVAFGAVQVLATRTLALAGSARDSQLATRNLLDTNTQSDWIESRDPGALLYGPVNEGDLIGKRVMYPGWASERFSHTLRITTTAHLTVAVAPDNSYDAIVAQLGRAQESIYLEGYALTNIHFGRVISDLIATRGISVTVLLDTATYSENREKWICQQIEQVGGRVYLMHNLDDTKRYADQHAKFIIVDERVVVIGSENYGYGAMPVDDKSDGTSGNRGAILITDAEPVVQWALDIFRADANPERRDIARWGTRPEFGPPPVGYTPPITTGGGTGYTLLTPEPLTVEGEMFFEVIQSPETSLSYDEGLIGLLRQAGPGDTILVEMLNESKHWGGVNGELDTDPNPRVEAYIQAARRGARVRVLLDEAITYGGNQPVIDYLNATALTYTLDLEARSTNPTGEGIHNKMVLAHIGGRGYVFVSSINGTAASNRRNREMGLLVQSDSAYAHLERIFDFDWEPLRRVYLPVAVQGYIPPAHYPLISEVLYDPVGAEPDREWIEIHNPTSLALDLSGYHLGDAAARDDYEGMFIFPAGTALPPRAVLVVAVRGTDFRDANGFDPDFEIVESDPAIPNLVDDPAWGERDLILLGNLGDEVLLLDPGYAVVDVLAYGTGSYPGVVSYAGPLSYNHSLERYPAWVDTDDCNLNFRDQPLPTPGRLP